MLMHVKSIYFTIKFMQTFPQFAEKYHCIVKSIDICLEYRSIMTSTKYIYTTSCTQLESSGVKGTKVTDLTDYLNLSTLGQ